MSDRAALAVPADEEPAVGSRRGVTGMSDRAGLAAPADEEPAVGSRRGVTGMSDRAWSVAVRIEFCYGHRLLDHTGRCRHAHGHNAVAEIEVRSATLDRRDMVCDFADLRRAVEAWVDRELDHKMILKRGDPLVEALRSLGEPVYVIDTNPTAERIAKLIHDVVADAGLPVVRVTLWETPSSFATYGEAGG